MSGIGNYRSMDRLFTSNLEDNEVLFRQRENQEDIVENLQMLDEQREKGLSQISTKQ